MNLPNKLTTFRVILIPFFVFFLLAPYFEGYGNYIELVIFIVASLTDFLDGKIARKYNLVTNFGKFMDPLADKLLVCSALICLIALDRIPAWIVIVIISREITVSALREWMAELGARTSVAVSTVGKYKTAFQMIAISVFLLNWQPLEMVAYLLLYTAVILTLWSMFIYLKAAWPYLKQP